MKKYKLLLSTLAMLFSGHGIIRAQINLPASTGFCSTIGLHTGLEYNLYLDELATPLIYKGNGIQIGLDYNRQKIKSEWDISLDYADLGEKAKYHQDRILYITPLEYIPELDITGDTILQAKIFPAKLPHLGLRIAWYRKIGPNKVRRIATCWGASFAGNLRIPVSDNVIVFTPIWLNEFSFAVKSSYAFNSNLQLSLGAELPAFSIVTRLPYSISPVEPNTGVYESALSNVRIETWNNYQSARAFLGINFLLRKRIMLRFNFSSYYLHYSNPKSIHFLQTNSTIGFSYNLSKSSL